jgi:hypothetical protein
MDLRIVAMAINQFALDAAKAVGKMESDSHDEVKSMGKGSKENEDFREDANKILATGINVKA